MAVQRLFLGRMNGSRNLANVVTFVIKSRIPAIPNFAVLIKYWRRIRLSNTLPGAWRVAALTTRVLRLAPFWPIFRLEFVHGTRKVGEIFSDVERILIAQGAALPERHVVFDERGSGKRAGHTGAVVGENTGFGKNRALRQRVLQCRTAFDPKQPFASMRSFSFCCRLND